MIRTGLNISNEISSCRTIISYRKTGKVKSDNINELQAKLKGLLDKRYQEVI